MRILQRPAAAGTLSATSRSAVLYGAALAGLVLATCGCGQAEKAPAPPHARQQVSIVRPKQHDIRRTVSQPAFVVAYEQTSLYPKVSGYIQQWAVDIGDPLKKDQLMTVLFVPELDAELEQRKANAHEKEVLVHVAEELVNVAESRLNAAKADAAKAQADVGTYQSAVERWESEVQRLTGLAAQRVIDAQILGESQKQLKSNIASRDAALAAVTAAEAIVRERGADLAKARVDVDAAQARYRVAQAEVQRYTALVSYTRMTAPYDGVVVVRNANTGDFVEPATGDRSTLPPISTPLTMRGTPVYIVARTDVVRVYADVPEGDADYIEVGNKAQVHVQAMYDGIFTGDVTRTSWSLDVQTRTLRAEIDLPNPGGRLRPGMYANADIVIDRKQVFAIPPDIVFPTGNDRCCYLLEDGKAVRTPVLLGPSDDSDQWIEIVKKEVHGKWSNITGDEQFIQGNLAEITNGEAVDVRSDKAKADEPSDRS